MNIFQIKSRNNILKDVNKPKLQKIVIINKKKLIYYSNFFHRYIGLVYDDEKKEFINNFYITKQLKNWIIKKFLSVNIFDLELTLPKKLFFIFNYFKKKKKIEIKDNELIMFGPWSHIYFHQIIEWVTRIILISDKYKVIYLPDHLKRILKSKIFRNIFKNLNFKFYSTKNNYLFYNSRYLTLIDYRKKNYLFTKTLNKLRSEVIKRCQKSKKSVNYKYILVSREKTKRRIINENELYEKLKIYGFKKILFENYSVNEQLKISTQAKIMIGLQGSGLANIAFMKKNSLLIQITNNYFNNKIIKNVLCKSLKLDYKEFPCKKSFKNLDVVCDIDKIEKFIKNYLSSKSISSFC